MPNATLEQRVTQLEQLVQQMLQANSAAAQPGRDDWKKTFGMFAGDAIMKQIIDAGERIREEDRPKARR